MLINLFHAVHDRNFFCLVEFYFCFDKRVFFSFSFVEVDDIVACKAVITVQVPVYALQVRGYEKIAEKLNEKGFSNLLDHYKTYKDPETGKEPTNEKEFALYSLKYATQNLWDPAKHKGGDKFNGWEEFLKAGVWISDPYAFR